MQLRHRHRATRTAVLTAVACAVLCGTSAPAGAAQHHEVRSVSYPGPGEVALTFDDGPHPRTTRDVAEILERHRVRGTFFVVGRSLDRNRRLVRILHRRGHSIQNHTWNHPNLRRSSTRAVRQELDRTSRMIESVTGETPSKFRPPYGATDRRVKGVGASLGLEQVMWGAASSRMEAGSREMTDEITAQARRARSGKRGLVVLLHDGSGNRTGTVAALPGIIAELQRQGWTFVVLR